MNKGLKSHIIKSLGTGIRGDGRSLEDYREITIEKGVSSTAEGSARVKIGDTEVIVGVKLSIDKPFSDRPDEGIVMVGTELLAMSSPEFESGPPSIWSIEIARVTDRGIRESKSIDVKALCITPGEKVWLVSVDICTLNDDGNILDAASLGALAALQDVRLPKVEDNLVNYKEKTDEKLPLQKLPIGVTVLKVGNEFIVDPTSEEEKMADSRLTITSMEDGHICAMQKGGDAQITAEDVEKMVELSIKKSAELRRLLE
ncbi:RNA-binding protein [Candidatus Woesearchaeota archaeon CG11_big_fil_rev_8_21_14_0_20_43_8]|nr:MAG: RNA-binding protein [Candidatus Woesearchaeota archaeon CG11_big_fil_rev_8_21_14_0_20_43_8]